MHNKLIIDKISSLPTPSNGYSVFHLEDKECFFGKDKENNVVFMITSISPNIPAVYQETKSLRFIFNQKCTLQYDGKIETKVMHLLLCKDKTIDKISAFIRLTKSFSESNISFDQYYLAKLFTSIAALFDKKRNISEIEIQGLFAELYTIIYFSNLQCDLSKFWQTTNKMKFDFSISSKKRIEIKSTLKSERIHHFKHDQLLSELYDIRIVSIMLQKNDCGISLKDVINLVREKYANNFALMLRIDTIVSQIDAEKVESIKYDETYLKRKIKFYDAATIPHFNEKTPDGVFNAEYDCNLDIASELDTSDVINWVSEG
ncbi:MAG: PD-(D/E)XK motif protein [Alphaproteobacteria bacterium]|nr:PD-(D/E)XK motif protein [Alphaproteobacteria bacterium]